MRAALLPFLLALTGCMAQGSAQQAQALPEGALRCIDLGRVTARRVERGALVYELVGGVTYRNDLQGTCPSLQRATGNEVIQTENQGPQLCRDDRVRLYDAVEAQAVGATAFPQCRVGNFVPVAAR